MSPKPTWRVDHWKDPEAPKQTSRMPSASVLVRDELGHVLLLWGTDIGSARSAAYE